MMLEPYAFQPPRLALMNTSVVLEGCVKPCKVIDYHPSLRHYPDKDTDYAKVFLYYDSTTVPLGRAQNRLLARPTGPAGRATRP